MTINEARLAILASSPNASPAEVEARAQQFLAYEASEQANAEFRTVAEAQARQDAEERQELRSALLGASEAAEAELEKRVETEKRRLAAARAQGQLSDESFETELGKVRSEAKVAVRVSDGGTAAILADLKTMVDAGEGW